MAQLNSASDFGSEGWGFESLRGHELRQVARYLPFIQNKLLLYNILNYYM